MLLKSDINKNDENIEPERRQKETMCVKFTTFDTLYILHIQVVAFPARSMIPLLLEKLDFFSVMKGENRSMSNLSDIDFSFGTEIK